MSLPILDVAIGISFVYLLLALICTTVNEMLAGMRKTRARFLDKGILHLLGKDPYLKHLIFAHPLIRSMSSKTTVCPSYLPAAKFATVLMDVVETAGAKITDVGALPAAVKKAHEEG